MKRLALLVSGVVALVAAGAAAYVLILRDDAPPPPRLEQRQVEAVEGDTALRVGAGSFVGYRVDEEFLGVGSTTAVGRTEAVTGAIEIDGTTVQSARLTADLTQLRSDEARRDRALSERGLETSRYPQAEFTLGGAFDVSEGEQAVRGTLVLHGRSAQIEVTVSGSLQAGRLELVGSAPIRFADFAIEPPSLAGFVTVEDEGTLEFHLLAGGDGA